jgi:hypothetical protein
LVKFTLAAVRVGRLTMQLLLCCETDDGPAARPSAAASVSLREDSGRGVRM